MSLHRALGNAGGTTGKQDAHGIVFIGFLPNRLQRRRILRGLNGLVKGKDDRALPALDRLQSFGIGQHGGRTQAGQNQGKPLGRLGNVQRRVSPARVHHPENSGRVPGAAGIQQQGDRAVIRYGFQ